MKALSYRRGRLEAGLPLDIMAQAFKALGKANPQATVEDVMKTVALYWDPGMGPGQATVERDGHAPVVLPMPHRTGKKTKPGVAFFEVPCVLRLAPESGEGLTVNVAASGSYTVVGGAATDAATVLPGMAQDTPLQAQARAWLRDGQVGSSSYALCVALTGVTDPHKDAPTAHDVPWDAGDLQRCQRFFEAVPLARPLVGQMASQGPYWAAVAPLWDTLEAAMAQGDRDTVRETLRAATQPVQEAEHARWAEDPEVDPERRVVFQVSF